MLHSPLCCSFFSRSWTLSPYCLDSSLVSFFKVSWPSFSCQQACQLLQEVEISSNCWTQCYRLVGYNLSVRNLQLWFILIRNVGIIVLQLFYIYFVHACSVVSNSEQIGHMDRYIRNQDFHCKKKDTKQIRINFVILNLNWLSVWTYFKNTYFLAFFIEKA